MAKYRAGRRLWARIMRERFGATSDRACMFRVGCVCGGASLTAEQPLNNIVQIAYQALAATLGGVQSMFTCAWDEALTIPSEETAELALRTQQVLAEETGIAAVVDPLGGSHYVEELTDRFEAEAERIIGEIEELGGMVPCIENGTIQLWIADRAYEDQRRLGAATASSSASTSTAARRPHRASSSTRSTRTSWPRRSSASGGYAGSGIRSGGRARWRGCGGRNGHREPDALPRRVLPRLLHARRDGGRPARRLRRLPRAAVI